MGQINPTLPVSGVTPNSTADPEVVAAFNAILGVINGGIDSTNLSTALAQALAVNQPGVTVKGAVNIATPETRTNTAYGIMPTPDQVTGLVLPVNGLILMAYQATWQGSASSGTISAAPFLNAVQVGVQNLGSNVVNPIATAASLSMTISTQNQNQSLSSGAAGLQSTNFATPSPYMGDVTTGQLVGSTGQGGFMAIFAAAGTYTVSVQFKASTGSVTASSRKLWVQALSFA